MKSRSYEGIALLKNITSSNQQPQSNPFQLNGQSFMRALETPLESRHLGDIYTDRAPQRGSTKMYRHFYIAPLTIRPTHSLISTLPVDPQITVNHYFRTPPMFVTHKVTYGQAFKNQGYSDFKFYPIGQLTGDIASQYRRQGDLSTPQGIILLNNVYSNSGNWCFGDLSIHTLTDNLNIIDDLPSTFAIESIIANFFLATPNNDLYWYSSDARRSLDLVFNSIPDAEIKLNELLERRDQIKVGFWNILNYYAESFDIDLTSKTEAIKLDEFWKVYIPELIRRN